MSVSKFLLERYNLGEVTPDEKQRVDAALRGEEGGTVTAELAALRESDRAIREGYLQKRISSTERFRKPSAFPGRKFRIGAVAAVAGAVLLTATAAVSMYYRNASFGIRAKGGVSERAHLLAYLRTEGTPYLRSEGFGTVVALHEGDALQLGYQIAENAAYGTIFSIDGWKAVTLHYPYSETGDTRLTAGRKTALDEAYVLDGAPFFEIFFFVTSGSSLDAAEILEKARETAGSAEHIEDVREIEKAIRKRFKQYDITVLTVAKE
jgi:hypothetical protein